MRITGFQKAWTIFLRIVIAIGGAYCAASLLGIAVARIVPTDRASATLLGMVAGLAAWPGFVVLGFTPRDGRRAFGMLASVSALSAIVAFLGGWHV